MDIFGLFLLVLLGIELLETLKAYLVEDIVHVEVVMIVAIIAIARKVIILDLQEYEGMKLIGLATILITLSFGYKLLKQSQMQRHSRIALRRTNLDSDIMPANAVTGVLAPKWS